MTRWVVVFGGTGFLGRRVARHLLDRGHAVRLASRRAGEGHGSLDAESSQLERVAADITDDASTVPYLIWKALAYFAELLPRPPLTRNQVELMQVDTVAAPARSGFSALGIEPQAIESALEEWG